MITVDKGPGNYVRAGSARNLPKAMTLIADLVKEKMKDRPAWIHVLHTNAVEAAQNLAGQITALLPNAKITSGQIVPVLGVHTGPGCVGAVCGPLDVLEE